MKSSLILMPLYVSAKKSKCPFGYGGTSDAAEETDDIYYGHPKV